MTEKDIMIRIPRSGQPVLTLSGRLENYSTRRMHTHTSHQLLTIQNGVSLLVDPSRKQPLFGTMAAIIPAGLPHLSTVIGDSVTYKSLYFSPLLLAVDSPRITIFSMSCLSEALFDRIVIRDVSELESGLNRECLDLLLKVLAEDILQPVNLARLPRPNNPQNQRIIDFIEKNYARKLSMSDFVDVFPYSARHLSRLFKADLRIGIFDYLRVYRVLMASVALGTTPRTITEVAFECGYESISTFYRDFNFVFAVTPNIFKRRIRKPPRVN